MVYGIITVMCTNLYAQWSLKRDESEGITAEEKEAIDTDSEEAATQEKPSDEKEKEDKDKGA